MSISRTTVLCMFMASIWPGICPAGGKTNLDLRYRYELVDQDGFAERAQASTLRARLNYLSDDWHNWSSFLEFDATQVVFFDDYNSGMGTSSARRNRYPVVVDPDYTEVNQLFLQYSGFNDTRVRAGRQRILLDNQRFVGGVGWRQNEQTYDAVNVEYTTTDKATLSYSYVFNVNRIFGDDVPGGDNDNNSHLLNLRFNPAGSAQIATYIYAIDNKDVAAFSSNTYGIRLTANHPVAGKKLDYHLEYAKQRDAGNNPVNYDADYLAIDAAALIVGTLKATVGYELLSGSNSSGAAFRTPLATLHAFNGWADQFLNTPDTGLADTWLGLSTRTGNWKLSGTWHHFNSDKGNRHLGSELDVSAARSIGTRYNLLLKLATFGASDPLYTDTTKAWLMFSAGFAQ